MDIDLRQGWPCHFYVVNTQIIFQIWYPNQGVLKMMEP